MKIQFESNELVLFESALFRTITSLIITESYLLLVDPNWLPHEIKFIDSYISPLKIERKCYLLFTHSDYDHIIGYGKFKDFETIASQNFIDNPKKESILAEIRTFDDQYYILRDYSIEYPSIDYAILGKQQMQLGADTYQFYQALGHNSDGIISHNLDKQILIVGDYLSNIEFPYIYESVAKYMQTLRTLEKMIAQHPIKILITGHGDCATNKSEMRQRLADSYAYMQELQACVQQQKAFDTAALFSRYQFPKIMTQFHSANVALAKQEMDLLAKK